jgi:hypothetical protein
MHVKGTGGLIWINIEAVMTAIVTMPSIAISQTKHPLGYIQLTLSIE